MTGGSLADVVTRWIITLISALAVAMPAVQSAYAAKPKPKQSSMVIDGNTGGVLHNHDGDAARYPASLTKVMTIYMVFSEIEAGRLSFSTRIKATKHSASMPPSKLGLKPGQTITVKEAVTALVVKSANDIAAALADHIGGSERAFARAMTQRARQIGMTSTVFQNASGLPNDRQKTTARDMLTLALRIQDDFPQHYHMFSATSFSFRGKTYKSHNKLMKTFPGMDGMKTGYIRASGFNLMSSVRTGNKHIVGVVFGGKTSKARNDHMQTLLYRALARASTRRTRRGSKPLIARQRPGARVAAAAMPMPLRAPRQRLAQAPPRPAPAARPADRIAQVLEEGDASDGADTGGVTQPRLDLAALRAAMSDTEAEAAGPAPSPQPTAQASATSAPHDIASLIRNSLVEGEAAPRQARAQPSAQTPAATNARIVRQPSSLDAQARALGVEVAALPNQPMGASGPAASSGFHVQIGAYVSAAEAQRRIDHVRGRAGSLLAGRSGATIPVKTDNRQIYRARFVNFDEQSANATCLELRRQAIDCLVMRAE